MPAAVKCCVERVLPLSLSFSFSHMREHTFPRAAVRAHANLAKALHRSPRQCPCLLVLRA